MKNHEKSNTLEKINLKNEIDAVKNEYWISDDETLYNILYRYFRRDLGILLIIYIDDFESVGR